MSPYSFIVLCMVIISVVNAGDKVCPGYGFVRIPENCEPKCSIEKDECPTGKKCCFRVEQPCGFQCIEPKDNAKKPGKCPSTSSEVNNDYWGICDAHFCDVDNDCKGSEKCCHNPCGTPLCLPPQ